MKIDPALTAHVRMIVYEELNARLSSMTATPPPKPVQKPTPKAPQTTPINYGPARTTPINTPVTIKPSAIAMALKSGPVYQALQVVEASGTAGISCQDFFEKLRTRFNTIGSARAALHDLEAKGLADRYEDPTDDQTKRHDQRRRLWRLTDGGRTVLAQPPAPSARVLTSLETLKALESRQGTDLIDFGV